MNFEEFDILEDDIDMLEVIEYGFPRTVYVGCNPFDELDPLTFFRRFRLFKNTTNYLLQLIQHELEYPHELNNNCASPMNQLLTCLRFFVTNGHLSTVADFIKMDPSTASRIVNRVSGAIAKLAPQFIKIPTRQEFVREETKFYNIAGLPRVIGCVDGTHIKIQSPGGDEAEVFRNRKKYFSINTQVTCSADLKIINLVADWSGSIHDSAIFSNSNLKRRFDQGAFGNCFLIEKIQQAQELYQEALIMTRVLVERSIGVWKRRLPIMAYGSRLEHNDFITTIIATAVLHNLAIQMNKPEPPVPEGINEDELNYLIEMGRIEDEVYNDQQPNVGQQQIINYFANL